MLTGQEFLRQLQGDETIVPPIVLTGMAKKPEGDGEHILFARGTACANWTKIPVGLIDSVDVLRVVPCKDHSHPFVRLRLRTPDSEEAALFGTLLQQGTFGHTFDPMPMLRQPNPPQPPPDPPCHTDWYLFCDENGENCEWVPVEHCPDQGGHRGRNPRKRLSIMLMP